MKLARILKVFDKAQRELDIFVDKASAAQTVIEDKQNVLHQEYDVLAVDKMKAVAISKNLKTLLGDM